MTQKHLSLLAALTLSVPGLAVAENYNSAGSAPANPTTRTDTLSTISGTAVDMDMTTPSGTRPLPGITGTAADTPPAASSSRSRKSSKSRPRRTNTTTNTDGTTSGTGSGTPSNSSGATGIGNTGAGSGATGTGTTGTGATTPGGSSGY
jgi:hypothetical protein